MVAVTDSPGRVASGRRRARLRAARGGVAVEALLVGASSVLIAAAALHLWRADLGVPFRYAPVDDAKFYLMLVKGIVEHGWYATNSTLGAPFGQRLSDYPQGADNLSLVLVRALAVVSSDPATIVNVFFLLTFALAGLASHAVLRSLDVSARPAAIASILFALLPYHFFRGESHLLLSAYYAVPLSAYLFLAVLGGRSLFSPQRSGRMRWVSRRSATTLALCMAIGSASLYYATFAVVLLAGAVLVSLLAGRRRGALRGTVALLLVGLSVAANLAPSLIYRSAHGGNRALERSAAFTESSQEAFPLRLADLILPPPDSRIPALRSLTRRYDTTIAPGYCEACHASLGAVGTVGFGWLVLGALSVLAGVAGWFARRRLLRDASIGVLIAVAVGSIGGVSSLIEVFVTPDIRAWNRISVFIAFFSLVASATLIERVLAMLPAGRRGAALGALACAAILAVGVFDQTSDTFIPAYSGEARQWRSDQGFVEAIERRLPRDAAIFQLPYVPFPEGYPETPVGDQVATYATKYEALRGYLHSTTLRFSYGAVKGRPEDWPAQLAEHPLDYVLAAAAAAGFDGLWFDPAGFEPSKALQLRGALRQLLGVGPLSSAAGDLQFYDMRPYLARLRRSHTSQQLDLLKTRTLRPLSASCDAGGLSLENPSASATPATLTLRLAHSGTPPQTARALPPDGQAGDVAASATETITRRITLAPGASAIALADLAPRDAAHAIVLDVALTDEALKRFQTARVGAPGAVLAGLTGPPCA